jgi:hypothetical protein
MKNLLPLLFLFAFLTASGCKKNQSGENAVTTPEATTPPPEATALEWPPLGNREVATLYSQADKVDIIFYNHPISVNQEDPASVKSTTLYVSPASPKITAQCKALGRLTWMTQGVIQREADIYCEPGCEYFVFIENNKPVYANAMGAAGVSFFRNIITQAEQYKQNAK